MLLKGSAPTQKRPKLCPLQFTIAGPAIEKKLHPVLEKSGPKAKLKQSELKFARKVLTKPGQ